MFFYHRLILFAIHLEKKGWNNGWNSDMKLERGLEKKPQNVQPARIVSRGKLWPQNATKQNTRAYFIVRFQGLAAQVWSGYITQCIKLMEK